MAQQSDGTPLSRRFVRMMSLAIATDDGVPLRSISHHLPVVHAPGEPPLVYTIDVLFTDQGTCLLSCRELPEVIISCLDEGEGMNRIEAAIGLALQIQRGSPDLSY